MPWLSANARPGLISVIVPSFDRRDMLVELLDALAAQTWPALELIVVDDGSTDGTADRVMQWQQAHPESDLRVVRQENAGAAAARNRGLAEANGEFIYFIDSDDLIVPDALEAMASAMQAASAPYCLASIVNTDLSGTPIDGNRQGVPRLGAAGDAFGASWLMHAALYRRQAVIAAGPFDESLPLAEDNLFRWKVVVAFPRGQVLDREVGIRRMHPYGHLSRTEEEPRRREIQLRAILSFLAWYRALPSPVVLRTVPILRTLFICAVWLGSVGNWSAVRRACAEIRQPPMRPAAGSAALTLLLRLESRMLFRVVRTLLLLVQDLHRRLPDRRASVVETA